MPRPRYFSSSVTRTPVEIPHDSATAVDRWLRANLDRRLMRADPCQVTTEMYPEDVMITVRKHRSDRGGGTREELPTYTLFIQITIFEDADIEPRFRESPVAILERWEGLARVPRSNWRFFMDDWEMVTFRQPRCIASELFVVLARSDENIKEHYSSGMLRWASAVSMVHQARAFVLRRARALNNHEQLPRRSVRLAHRARSQR
ncbi:hypothetical protein EVG20_g8547 [Dentipellis fragilis]|uniref:Uncharacterized protein n=1 Tax=Dentipellis fragilis TaxID=205917 RepID=A0A4Y9Y6B3_9AGAM|nr:hypothetical protein EVG20_g8547 [Dentipellis fragilis]